MQETANIDVELEDTHVSDSSSDQEVDIDNMSEEELREFARREHEAKKEANRHMREQARKRKETQVVETQEPKQDKEDLSDVESVARKVVQTELRKQTIESISKGSDNWLKEQSFAKDLFGESEESDRLYARVKAQAQKLADEEGITSSEQYKNILRRAHVAITGNTEALLNVNSAEEYITIDKSQSSGYRGSTSQTEASYPRLSPGDKSIVDRLNKRREARGEKPMTAKEVAEILKK